MNISDNPIFILGAHKSGTTFLRNLIDGHPQIMTLPFETHFFKHYGSWIEYPFRSQKPFEKSLDKFLASSLDEIKARNNNQNPQSDYYQGKPVDTEKYETYFKKHASSDLDPKKLFEVYMNSLAHGLGMDTELKTVRICEKSVENSEFAPVLKKWFPNAKFIHIVRNPYDNLASFRQYQVNMYGRYPVLQKLVWSLHHNYAQMYKNKELLDDSYKVIKYEDLVASTEDVMADLAKFLDIKFTQSLLEVSSMGRAWQQNTSWLSKTKKGANNLEIHYVNKLFKPLLDDYDYKKATPSSSRLAPIKSESVNTYILNRLTFRAMLRRDYRI